MTTEMKLSRNLDYISQEFEQLQVSHGGRHIVVVDGKLMTSFERTEDAVKYVEGLSNRQRREALVYHITEAEEAYTAG